MRENAWKVGDAIFAVGLALAITGALNPPLGAWLERHNRMVFGLGSALALIGVIIGSWLW